MAARATGCRWFEPPGNRGARRLVRAPARRRSRVAPVPVPPLGVAATGQANDTHAIVAATREQGWDLLHSAPIGHEYRTALRAALELPGNLLSRAPNLRWARTVATCCTAAGGKRQQSMAAAAAVECFMVALDLLDDEEDGEDSPLRALLGPARTLNVSTGLLLLAQSHLSAQPHGASLTATLLEGGLRACTGQHADLASGPESSPPSLEAALAVTAGKAAPLVSAACRIGATLGGADLALQGLYGQFGACAGMISQLINDIAALGPDATAKTDIALGRPTIPLTYAALHGRTNEAGGAARQVNWLDGPVQLTWAIAATYRRHALDLVPQLTSDDTSRADLMTLVTLD